VSFDYPEADARGRPDWVERVNSAAVTIASVATRPKTDIQTIEFGSLMRSFIIAYLPAQLAPDHRSKKVAKLAGYENRFAVRMRHERGYKARPPYQHFPHSKHAGDPQCSRRARAFREVPSGRVADHLRGSEDPHPFRHRARE